MCEKCDGKCVICDSYVRPSTLVRICDECNYGSYQGRCVICGGPGVSDAYYCRECTILEKDVRKFCLIYLSIFFKSKLNKLYHRETAVLKLLTWVVPKRTCIMNGKNMGSKKRSSKNYIESYLISLINKNKTLPYILTQIFNVLCIMYIYF